MSFMGKLRKGNRDERGISSIIAVVSLIGILGAVMLSLDFGSMWSSRRVIITATDSSALRQASLAALGKTACNTNLGVGEIYTDFLYRQTSQIVPGSPACTTHPDIAHPGTGYVTVEARKYADTRFGGLFGFIGDTQPYSLTGAEYGYVNPAGLRPMSYCLQNAHVLQWVWYLNWQVAQGLRPGTVDPNFGQLDQTTYLAQKGLLDIGHPPVTHVPAQGGDSVLFVPPPDGRVDFPQGSAPNGIGGTSYVNYGVVHRMFFTKDTVYENGNCGASSGNWGWIDFSGGENANSDQVDWLLNGYDGQSEAGDCYADDTNVPCEGDTGSSGGSGAQELQTLVDSQAVFFIPIFTNVVNPGSNAAFTIWGFLPLVLRGFDVNGPQDSRYFDFEFKDAIASSAGDVSDTGGLGTPRGVKICAVDHDGKTTEATIAARCD